jgi:uncharacterized protein (TIGR02246 family)
MVVKLRWAVFLSGALLALFSVGQIEAAVPMPDLEATIQQSHRALGAILNGNPRLYEELFADRDDVTLGNPFGPFARGRAAVIKTLAGAASKYRDGSVVSVDLVAKYITGDMACIVEVENDRAKVGGSNDLAEFHVRVTSLYERIDGEWRLVHRHADPITTARPAESVLQK